MKILGINNEVTTCECCGRTNLKRTVVLASDNGQVHYGTECAAKALRCDAKTVTNGIRTAVEETARQRQIAANVEMDLYREWLLVTYGDTRSNLARRAEWRKAVAA
jgi:hypothetical protein